MESVISNPNYRYLHIYAFATLHHLPLINYLLFHEESSFSELLFDVGNFKSFSRLILPPSIFFHSSLKLPSFLCLSFLAPPQLVCSCQPLPSSFLLLSSVFGTLCPMPPNMPHLFLKNSFGSKISILPSMSLLYSSSYMS